MCTYIQRISQMARAALLSFSLTHIDNIVILHWYTCGNDQVLGG